MTNLISGAFNVYVCLFLVDINARQGFFYALHLVRCFFTILGMRSRKHFGYEIEVAFVQLVQLYSML